MSNIEKIKELRILTQAGMQDCKEALEISSNDINKAFDLIKAKGKLISNGSKIASEGIVGTMHFDNLIVMVEVNCVTDFVARMPEFDNFVMLCLHSFGESVQNNVPWNLKEVESAKQELFSKTKENIIVRRWWAEQKFKSEARMCSYVHTNNKIAAILHTLAPTIEIAGSKEFEDLNEAIVLQIAAMNPLAISPDKLDVNVVEKQTAIFQSQIDVMNKPQASHTKILEGKMNKWYTEVCLLNQESVVFPKTTVEQMIKNVNADIQVINFIRCQVGEGIEKPIDNFVDEVLMAAQCPIN